MKSFQDFWTFLETSHPQWWDFTKMRFGNSKNIKQCAMDCYAYLLADPTAFTKMDDNGKRKYFVSWLMKAPDAPVKPQLQQVEEVKIIRPEDAPLTGEARQIWLEKFKAQVLATPPIKPVAKISTREIISEGQWDAKKEPVHQNGIDQDLFRLNEAIKKFGRRKYMSLYSFSGFQTFKFGLVDVYAASESDAKEILKQAERYMKLLKLKEPQKNKSNNF